MNIVAHNLTAMNAQRQYGITEKSLAKSTEKLSSGYKVNRAADDAAGLSISEKMRKQIRGLTQASYNSQDGISFAQVAEGALNEVHDMLQRLNELAVKAANGTNSKTDRQYIDDEFQQIKREMERVFETTSFNERKIWREGEPQKSVNPVGQKIISSSVERIGEDNNITEERKDKLPKDDNFKIKLVPASGDNRGEDGFKIYWNDYEKNKYHETETIPWQYDGSKNPVEPNDPLEGGNYVLNDFLEDADKISGFNFKFTINKTNLDDVILNGNSDDERKKDARKYVLNAIECGTIRVDGYGDPEAVKNPEAMVSISNVKYGYAKQRNNKRDLTSGEGIEIRGDEFIEPQGTNNIIYSSDSIVANFVVKAKDGSTKTLKAECQKISYTGTTDNPERDGYYSYYDVIDEDGNLKKVRDPYNTRYYTVSGKGVLGVREAAFQLTDHPPGDPDPLYCRQDYGGTIKLDFKFEDSGEHVDSDFSVEFKVGSGGGSVAVINLETWKMMDLKFDLLPKYGLSTSFDSKWHVETVDYYLASTSIQAGADEKKTNQIDMKYRVLNLKELGIADTEVATMRGKIIDPGSGKTDIEKVFGEISDAFKKVSEQRSAFGAYQNRLEHTINNLDNVVENTTAAESQIRDTDMATQMVSYSLGNILAQAGQSMMAQANQSNQGVLSLLR